VPERFQAVFYRAPDGSEPVDDFIEALDDPDRQAAIDFQIDRLNLLTPAQPLHMFEKRTGKLPAREIAGRQGAMGRLQAADKSRTTCTAARSRPRRAVTVRCRTYQNW
jgi:hypothetical protein